MSKQDTTTSRKASLKAKRSAVSLLCFVALFLAFQERNWTDQFIVTSSSPCFTKTNVDSSATSDSTATKSTPDANTGSRFRGEKVRTYAGDLRLSTASSKPFLRKESTSLSAPFPLWPNTTTTCDKWAVVTTIFDPSESVITVGQLPDWCMVVVGDTKTPSNYLRKAGLLHKKNVVFLSAADQMDISKTHHVAFIDTMPYQSFARKNIGFLFAIRHGAKVIYDFDDDNTLRTNNKASNGQPLSPFNMSLDGTIKARVVLTRENVTNHERRGKAFNPYPLMQPSEPHIWPRGFPMQDINNPSLSGLSMSTTTIKLAELDVTNIGVLQAVCNGDPDVDAIYRLTRPLPVTFADDTTPLLVPPDSYAPYNAQATVHLYDAFWGLLLPMTVPGRVTDIWRSYFTQRMFRDLALGLVYVAPLVTHTRNVHDYLADMAAEDDLYRKTSTLLEFLDEWQPTMTTRDDDLPARLEELAIALYERAYIDLPDVTAMQEWLLALLDVGYHFPTIVRSDLPMRIVQEEVAAVQPVLTKNTANAAPNDGTPPVLDTSSSAATASATPPTTAPRYGNVVLMGQFNYNTDTEYVQHWAKRWGELFKYIQVRGPFNATNVAELKGLGIDVYVSEEDAGYYSPMRNLGNTLRMYSNVDGIQGVLFAHDDLLFNATHLEALGFPGDDLINQAPPDVMAAPYLLFNNEYMYRRNSGRNRKYFNATLNGKGAPLKGWRWWKTCIQSFSEAVQDPRSDAYVHSGSGLVPMYANAVGDFSYVPIRYAQAFAAASDWLTDHQVFLECGMPTIYGLLQEKENATVRFLDTCSFWTNRHSYPEWVPHCDDNVGKTYYPSSTVIQSPFGIYHPIKLSKYNFSVWDQHFDMIVLP